MWIVVVRDDLFIHKPSHGATVSFASVLLPFIFLIVVDSPHATFPFAFLLSVDFGVFDTQSIPPRAAKQEHVWFV